jgi:hypothetical protein
MTPVRAKQDAQPSAGRLLRPELAASMGGRFVSATGQSLAELLATFGVVSAGSERFMAGVLAFPPYSKGCLPTTSGLHVGAALTTSVVARQRHPRRQRDISAVELRQPGAERFHVLDVGIS